MPLASNGNRRGSGSAGKSAGRLIEPRVLKTVLLRQIVAVDGAAKVTVTLDLRGGYGRSGMTHLAKHGETWTGRSGGTWFRWSGAGKARHADGL